MADLHILDTHALIWYLEGSSRLGMQAKQVMQDVKRALRLPTIALAEALHIVGRGRTNVPSPTKLMQSVNDAPHIQLVPLTGAILQMSLRATAVSEMHDRLIVATALHAQKNSQTVYLITRDENIIASNLVPTLWH